MSEPWQSAGDDMYEGLRLQSGEPVTAELIEAIAREAEAGFAPEQLHPRPVGRPPLGDGSSFRVQFRVSPATFKALLARAREEERGVSEIARLALERYLSGAADCAPTENPMPESEAIAPVGAAADSGTAE